MAGSFSRKSEWTRWRHEKLGDVETIATPHDLVEKEEIEVAELKEGRLWWLAKMILVELELEGSTMKATSPEMVPEPGVSTRKMAHFWKDLIACVIVRGINGKSEMVQQIPVASKVTAMN